MPNPLTGDYEAVVQVANRQLNGLLGTLHQNGALEDAALKLLHSAALRIGDPPRRPPGLDVFADWLFEYYRARPGRGLRDVRTELAGSVPPGAAGLLEDALAEFDRDWVIGWPRDVMRGLAKAQVSSVLISVPTGSSTEVSVHARVRAHYYPDPNTTPLPAPIHGDVHATFEVRKRFTFGGRRPPFRTRLVVEPSADDSKIQFVAVPGTGLTAADQSSLSSALRKAIREGIVLLPVDLPSDFPFGDFKGLGSGSNQAIALPLQLSGAPLPASGVSTLTQSFVGSSGFAFAVNKDHVISLIDVEAIRAAIDGRPVPIPLDLGWLGSFTLATYTLRFSSGPTLTFKSGGIEISGRVNVEHDVWPDGYVKFKQLVRPVLDSSAQMVSLQRAGEPEVQTRIVPHSRAVNIVREEIDRALVANNATVRRVFDDAKDRLVRGLRTFDSAARVTYTEIETTPDGVVIRGEIGSAVRRAPIVRISETHGGQAFTAFQSWIPAGRIDRFVWSWVEHGRLGAIGSGTTRSYTDEHRFILPKPEGVNEITQICLRIEGTRINPDGHGTALSAGTYCEVSEPELTLDVPSWWAPVTLPIWQPDASETTTLRKAIAGHVSVQTDTPGKDPASRNTLVYFADWRADRPLDALIAALGSVKSGHALAVIVVLPVGAFDSSRREFEARLPKERERLGAKLQFTEDDDGGWTRMFGVTKVPSAYLMNARHQFVWKHEGEPDGAALAAALNQHLMPTPAWRFRPLRLAVGLGDPAPDAFFTDDDQNRYALHRLRGRSALLNFWQSWSSPCLEELSHLQRLYEAEKEKPFIVAFHGGKDGKALDEIRKRLNLSFPLVQDAQQRVARLYGVRCWPTTITVDSDGRVEHVQFGTGHEHEPARGPEQSKPAQSKPAQPHA